MKITRGKLERALDEVEASLGDDPSSRGGRRREEPVPDYDDLAARLAD